MSATQTGKCTLLTIFTESTLEHVLIKDMDRLGMRGYTISDARGKGSRGGVRDAAWDEAANVRVEVICPRAMAEDVLRHLQVRYYANYSMVTFLTEIEVVRPDKL